MFSDEIHNKLDSIVPGTCACQDVFAVQYSKVLSLGGNVNRALASTPLYKYCPVTPGYK